MDGGFVPGGSEFCLSLREPFLRDGDFIVLVFIERKSPLNQSSRSFGDLFGSVSGFQKLDIK